MNSTWFRVHVPALVLLVATAVVADDAQAYIGPGAGISAIGTVFAVLSALVLAVGVIVWYPVKRVMRRRRAAESAGSTAKAPDRA